MSSLNHEATAKVQCKGCPFMHDAVSAKITNPLSFVSCNTEACLNKSKEFRDWSICVKSKKSALFYKKVSHKTKT
jgi:hypothetical protein